MEWINKKIRLVVGFLEKYSNTIIATFTIILVISNLIYLNYFISEFQIRNRPYININQPNFVFYNIDKAKFEQNNLRELNFNLDNIKYINITSGLENTGIMPAKIIEIRATIPEFSINNVSENSYILFSSEQQQNSIDKDLIPIEKIYGYLKNEKKFNINIIVKYKIINSNKIFFTQKEQECFFRNTDYFLQHNCRGISSDIN